MWLLVHWPITQTGLINDDMWLLVPTHDGGREEAILEDVGTVSYLDEALSMPSVGASIVNWRIGFYINMVVA